MIEITMQAIGVSNIDAGFTVLVGLAVLFHWTIGAKMLAETNEDIDNMREEG